MNLDVHGFADPWEHLRLLSDLQRNKVLLGLLARRAPGARVLEIGCGTGLLSLVAAKMGARQVFAVEPTELSDVARQLVADNQLSHVVRVIDGMIEEVPAQPVDLVFSELLNADPFLEGVVSASEAGARWLAQDGHLAPRRLRVLCAPVACEAVAQEASRVSAFLTGLEADHGLRLGLLRDALTHGQSERSIVDTVRVVGPAITLYDVPLGQDFDVDEPVQAELIVRDTAHGVVVWFEAELDEGLVLSNPPGSPGHWGHLQCAFAQPMNPGAPVAIVAEVDELELEVRLA